MICRLAVVSLLLLAQPSRAEQPQPPTPLQIVQLAADNIKGPPGKMLTTYGRLEFPGTKSEMVVARLVSENGTEGVQVDFTSAIRDETGGGAQGGRIFRLVRNEAGIRILAYMPSLRRGRGVAIAPDDGVLGSAYPFYFLGTVSDVPDFTYSFQKQSYENPVILATRKEESLSPYTKCVLTFTRHENTYFLNNSQCSHPEGRTVTQILSAYREVANAPQYWAPLSIVATSSSGSDKTTIQFEGWTVQTPKEWLISTNHATLENQRIPMPLLISKQ